MSQPLQSTAGPGPAAAGSANVNADAGKQALSAPAPGILGDVEAKFRGLDLNAIAVQPFLDASTGVARIYEAFFGNSSGGIAKMMTTDLVNHTNQVAALHALYPDIGQLLPLAQKDLDTRGADVVKKDRSATGGARGLLWLVRAMQFLAAFMRGLSNPESVNSSPGELAKEAYANTLKAHHGWALSNVVRMALGTVPSREQLLQSFSLNSNDEARAALRSTTEAMQPVLERILAWYKEKGYDWPDKAGF